MSDNLLTKHRYQEIVIIERNQCSMNEASQDAL